MLAKGGPIQLQMHVGLSEHPSVEWSRFVHEAEAFVFCELMEPIGGPGIRVQLDESGLRHHKYHRGRVVGLRNVLLFCGISDTGEVFILLVPNLRKKTLWPLIRYFGKPGNRVLTDGAAVYKNLCRAEGQRFGFDFEWHKTVNHKKGDFVHLEDDGEEVTTNAIENCWRWAKEKVPK